MIDGTYSPLSRPIFIYVNEKCRRAPRGEGSSSSSTSTHGRAARRSEVKYVPLPDEAYDLAASTFAKGKTGTVFGGVPEVGVTIEELLAREAKL